MNNNKILEKLNVLDFAFQPIVDIETSEIYAVEALLRNVDELGYHSIHHFFDEMYQHNLLYAVDLVLREKAIKKFVTLENYASMKLFYNLDNRLLEMKDYASGHTNAILNAYNLDKSAICFEISERHEVTRDCDGIMHLLEHYKREGFSLAIDDFGVGFSGFKLLYEFTPDVIKIDRFFLSGICKDPKKKIIVENIIQLAKRLGVQIIAEGVELQSELDVCIDIGCEYVQGYLIQRPSCQIEDIRTVYSLFTQVA
ncbi:MAG: EAL domain-containing protein [Helicobacteraceae bacterium]|jgi:EAL domain-containing protein (putative c-di-GMP-specific phosphodiesterase class I)|nr:EAL domain-containing protein [Helicobacteraceae bacterium]